MAQQTPQSQAIDLAKEIFCNNHKGQLLTAINNPPILPDKPIWDIDPDALNPYDEVQQVQTWCKIGERPALPKEGIITISAKQKQGKSLSTYAMAQALLSGMPFDTLTPTEQPNMVMVFDMEMSATTLLNRVKSQVLRLGKHSKRFVVYPLKAKSIADRIAMINNKVNQYHPDIIIIDQCAKLVANGNDLAESNGICDWLDKLSIGRSVWVVMHENKGADDTNMKGHLGSFLSYSAVEAYSVNRKEGVFTINYREGRDTDSDNALPIHFAVDTNGAIIDANAIAREAQERERQAWVKNFAEIFGDNATMRSVDIIKRICEKEGLEERSAKTKIATAKSIGAIRKISNDHNAPYELVHA